MDSQSIKAGVAGPIASIRTPFTEDGAIDYTKEWERLYMLNRTSAVRIICLFGLIGFLSGTATAAARALDFPRYRDLSIYATSAPDERNPARIIGRVTFINRGERELELEAGLQPSQALGFSGATHEARLQPGTSAVWTWTFTPPADVTRVILSGEIHINDRLERDLFIAVEGTDAPGYGETSVVLHSHLPHYHAPLLRLYNAQDNPGSGKITERARVVATYAPRNRQSIRTQRSWLEANRPDPVLTLAAAGRTEYVVLVGVLPPAPEEGGTLAFWRERKLSAPEREL